MLSKKREGKKRKKKMPADATNGKAAACFGVVTARERAFASLL